jgi:hypothetical protein
MENAFLLMQQIRESLDVKCTPFDNDHLGAQRLIEMDVRRGKDHVMMVVLKMSQALGQPAFVMVVEQRDGPDGLLVLFPFSLHETVANHISDELGPVRVPPFPNQTFEPLEKRLLYGEAQSCNTAHDNLGLPYPV